MGHPVLLLQVSEVFRLCFAGAVAGVEVLALTGVGERGAIVAAAQVWIGGPACTEVPAQVSVGVVAPVCTEVEAGVGLVALDDIVAAPSAVAELVEVGDDIAVAVAAGPGVM